VFGSETLHPLLSHCSSLSAFVTSSSALVALFPPVCARRAGSLRPLGTCYSFSLVFISSPLCCVVLTPPLLFSLLFFLSFLSLLCLQVPLLSSKIVGVCLDIIILIPGLFHDPGLSSESLYFNAGENKVVWRGAEIPLWWQSPKSNNSTLSLRSIVFLTQSPWSRALGTGVPRLKSQPWLLMDRVFYKTGYIFCACHCRSSGLFFCKQFLVEQSCVFA